MIESQRRLAASSLRTQFTGEVYSLGFLLQDIKGVICGYAAFMMPHHIMEGGQVVKCFCYCVVKSLLRCKINELVCLHNVQQRPPEPTGAGAALKQWTYGIMVPSSLLLYPAASDKRKLRVVRNSG